MLFYRKLVNPCSLLPPQADLQGRGREARKGNKRKSKKREGKGSETAIDRPSPSEVDKI